MVLALQANFCLVALEVAGPDGRARLLCTRRTLLAKSGQRICVGDRVRVEAIDWSAGRGVVAALEPRTNLLPRPAVANVSRILVVAALREPDLDPLQLTRFLVTAEASGTAVQVVLSKVDLAPLPDVEAWCERLRGWGYAVHAVSARAGVGIEALRHSLAEPGIVVVCGPSGVGKSSLLNALRPDLELRTAAVSGRLRRGRHTTRHVELFSLGPALVADSPGFNRPELPEDPASLERFFPELRRQLSQQACRFRNCRHLGDPGCGMAGAWDRQKLYGHCLAELLERGAHGSGQQGEALRQRGDRREPRLNPQLRRGSRRLDRQRLDAALEEDDSGEDR
ncbi:MAG: ribosome small subunit-dependent GTPase A [Cyanobium sp.]